MKHTCITNNIITATLIYLADSCTRPKNSHSPICSVLARALHNQSASASMWDDEDNNPYGSFQRRGSESSDIQSPGERKSVFVKLAVR
jgi:hypothetical protein